MDKFNLNIDNSSQKKIRKVNNLPLDDSSTALAWFNSKPVTPANNISVTDLSNFIPENSYSSNINASNRSAKNKIVFANELGILEDSDGYTLFDSDDISVSDTFLNARALDKKYYTGDIEKNGFVHSFYVSRYYTLLPKSSYGYDGLDDFLLESSAPKSIKVIDKNGFEYVDQSTGLKKYRVLIEQLDLPIYSDRSNLPCKIIVLFDSPSPVDLSLVYDKVILSSTESISSTVPQYKENINTVSIFNRVGEESIVVDSSSRSKKIYSKKSITGKNNLINSTNARAEGFEIFVPKKALSDNRTYESFNWRLITKVKRSVDVSSINNGEEIDSESSIKQKVINCAVLSTTAQIASMQQSNDFGAANPYVFLRLQQSPFNTSKYTYANPLFTDRVSIYGKYHAMYWLLNIDTVTDDQLSLYDIVTWTPSSPIAIDQGLRIKKYLEKTQGTLVLDLSKLSSGAETIDPALSVSTQEYALDTWTYNSENIFINENKTNAWPINSSVFERLTVDNINYDVYSIFGRSNLSDLTTKKTVKEFTGNISTNNVVLNNSRSKPIFVSLEFAPSTDSLSKGTLLATTTPMLKYCNDIYQPSSIFDIATSNNGPMTMAQTTFVAVAAIEGPMKLLYNACSVALLSRAFSSRVKDLRSSMYYQVSNWQSSYVLNGNALLEDEKKEIYSLIKVDNENAVGTSKYARNLIPSNSSVLEFYKKSIYDFLADQHSISLQEIDSSNLEFYIEVTNNDVEIANATPIKGGDRIYLAVVQSGTEIPTSYNLFRVDNDSTTGSIYAYTDSPSAQFTIPGGFGPHVIRERLYRSSTKEINDQLSSSISSSNSYKNYTFNFSIFNSYNQSSESTLSFSANWSAVMTAKYTATLSRQARYEDVHLPGSRRLADDVAITNTFETDGAFSGADRIDAYKKGINSNDPVNNFLYTGDIQQGNVIGAYGIGTTTSGGLVGVVPAGYRGGTADRMERAVVYSATSASSDKMLTEYIKYIQISMREAGILVAGKLPELSGKFEVNTFNAVKAFQISVNARFENGKVDSETKSLIAIHVWKSIKNSDPTRYSSIIARLETNNPTVVKYVVAAADAIELHDLPNRDWNYRKITFTGQSGPKKLVDSIFLAVPFNQIPFDGITQQDLKNQVLKSVTIYPRNICGCIEL